MRRRACDILPLMAAVLMTLVTVGCDVHEFPDAPEASVERKPLMLDIKFNTGMPLYQEIEYTRNGETKSTVAGHDIRYIVNAYRNGDTRGDSRVADATFVFTRPESEGHDHRMVLDLDEGEYTFRVWSDYVNSGTTDDKHYNTGDFSEIILADRENHHGSTDSRDAFRGVTTATVSGQGSQATVEMQRPMGKFRFVSTDVEPFLTRVYQTMKEKGLLQDTEYDGKATYDQIMRSIDLNEFTVVFRYNAFMPCSFNMFTDKPADSWTGMSFTSRMEADSPTEMTLGYDYIFVNGTETTVSVSVEVYDSDGTLLSSTNPINVPVVRGKLTIVKGEFLTSKATGGVTINPGYDGTDYNIEIK